MACWKPCETRHSFDWGAGLVVLAITVGVFLWPAMGPGIVAQALPSVPPVAWNPARLVVTVSPGDSSEAVATASTRRPIPATIVELVPSLSNSQPGPISGGRVTMVAGVT